MSHGTSAPGGGTGQGGNLLIQADNLPALRALRETHAGRIQCVYIDPPYNTWNRSAREYEDGSAHPSWLTALRDCLEAIHALMAVAGALFVHLDDNEMDYLKVVLDEVFGRNNFVSRITVAARSPSAFSTVNRGVFKSSEYLLWYARDRSRLVEHEVRVPRPVDGAYSQWLVNPADDCALWRFMPLRQAIREEHPLRPGDEPVTPSARVESFVLENAPRVFRLAPISATGAGRATLATQALSRQDPGRVFRVDRGAGKEPQYVVRGQQMVFYDRNVRVIDGRPAATRPLTNVWTDIAWEGIAGEGGVRFKKGKKPERLLKRCLDLCTRPGDIVLDAFAGSGTTAAVAHKMGRRWIAIEQGDAAVTHCARRLRAVVDGTDPTGISRSVGWTGGGGFHFCRVRSATRAGGPDDAPGPPAEVGSQPLRRSGAEPVTASPGRSA